jgi:hypothetical protein
VISHLAIKEEGALELGDIKILGFLLPLTLSFEGKNSLQMILTPWHLRER